ncbi:hypothetical protein XENOCAPTIV_019986 [Xenoophorus captivus]|uniref:LRRK2 beta-propeller domain-containing protein n=1 Tax=Xenoophorus captivus TaxID=1517983 RepID=A0ABV0QSV3_9TELE
MCLGQSTHSLDSRSIWAGCGTKILSFSVDYDVCKSIDTRPHPIFQRGSRVELPSEASPSWATVKALMMQNTAALWIGTRGGYLLLLELSNHQTLQVMAPSCNSICSISSAFKRGSPI